MALAPMQEEGRLESKLVSSVGAVKAGGGKLVISVQGRNVETAVIVSQRQTICVSSQHGCSMACRFCDTGLNSQGSNLPLLGHLGADFACESLAPARQLKSQEATLSSWAWVNLF